MRAPGPGTRPHDVPAATRIKKDRARTQAEWSGDERVVRGSKLVHGVAARNAANENGQIT